MSDWSDRRDRRRTSAATGAEAVSFLDETSRSVQHGMSRIMTDMPSPTACEASDELPGRMLINAPVRTAAPPPAAALAPPLTAPTAPAATATETVDSTMASALSMITASAAETAVHVSNRKASVAALPEGSVSVLIVPRRGKAQLDRGACLLGKAERKYVARHDAAVWLCCRRKQNVHELETDINDRGARGRPDAVAVGLLLFVPASVGHAVVADEVPRYGSCPRRQKRPLESVLRICVPHQVLWVWNNGRHDGFVERKENVEGTLVEGRAVYSTDIQDESWRVPGGDRRLVPHAKARRGGNFVVWVEHRQPLGWRRFGRRRVDGHLGWGRRHGSRRPRLVKRRSRRVRKRFAPVAKGAHDVVGHATIATVSAAGRDPVAGRRDPVVVDLWAHSPRRSVAVGGALRQLAGSDGAGGADRLAVGRRRLDFRPPANGKS